MWFVTHPEELNHYQYKGSLKKAKEALALRYKTLNGEDLKRLPEHHILRKGRAVLRDNLWYTGVSSNPLLSLAAHGVDLRQSSKFACWVIPVKYARELKAEALTLDQFRHAADDASDYIAEEQPYTYLYNFLVEEGSALSIDTAGFIPLKYVPDRPAQIFVWYADGTRASRNVETQDRDSYPEILKNLLEKAREGAVTRLLLRCADATVLQCDFREDGYDLLFDSRTSQSGYVDRCLPEEGRKGDWELLYDILLYFLRFYKTPKGTRWEHVRTAMASDHIQLQDGMLCDFS